MPWFSQGANLGIHLPVRPLVDPHLRGRAADGQATVGEPSQVEDRVDKDEAVDFVVVGPETALVSGLVDRLDDAGIKAFGPTAAAARLEGSKSFMKKLCASYDIPTAAYGSFTDAVAARAYITSQGAPIVIKADGLTAGKGVTVAKSVDEAYVAVDEAIIDGQFGGAGREIVIEEFLVGEEVSFFVFCDGKTILPLASAQDHKTVFDGDKGPNTGGMGAYSPAPIMTEVLAEDIMARIIRPTVAAMAEIGTPYKGVLYAGIVVTEEGPKLLEYNVRFGDPECQVLCMRLMSDLLPALIATHDGVLDTIHLRWRKDVALTVIMATKGYPKAYETGSSIGGIEEATAIGAGDVVIFHAGTSLSESGRLIANGGRVLNVTALTGTIERAQALAYMAIDLIDWPEGFCRRDIGWRAIKSDTG